MRSLLDCFTGADNATLDLGRIQWFMLTLAFIAFTGWKVYKDGSFDGVSFCAAGGGLLVCGAYHLRIKAGTEPPPGPPGQLIPNGPPGS